MMKKLFIQLPMLLFVLAMSTNVAWADDPNPETDYYWAKLTAMPAAGTGGSGKVYVSTTYESPENIPDESWQSVSSSAAGYREVYVQVGGSDNVGLWASAKADAGCYFAGWSYLDGSVATGNPYQYSAAVSPKKGLANANEYAIRANFEPIRLVSYAISGQTTLTTETAVTLTVTFQFDQEISLEDFETYASSGDKQYDIVKKDGTPGTWSKPSTGTFKVDGTVATAKVRLKEANDNGEYAATMTVTTKAGISVSVPLYVRKAENASGNAALYDGKTQMATGTVEEMLEVNTEGYTNPILKLSGDCSAAVAINKNITFDLNGYNLSNTLTVSGGNVTLAYSPYGGSANALNVTGGKAILNGGTFSSLTIGASGEVEQNGAIFTGLATNNGSLTTTDGTFEKGLISSNTLVVNGGTFGYDEEGEYWIAIKVTGGTAHIKRGVITGDYGVQTTGGTAVIEKLADFRDVYFAALKNDGGSIVVNSGKFIDPDYLAEGEITFHAGYFQTNSGEAATVRGKQVWRNTAGVEYREGYMYFVGDQDAARASNVSVCRIGTTAYVSLEEALAYANNNPTKAMLIFMENDYTLPAGYYTIPANATLIVPLANDQKAAYTTVQHESTSSYPTPYAFRTLTFADGVNMSVLGTIELSCVQYSKNGDVEQSIPGGPFGHLVLKPGSHITLNSGGELRAWGYVTGDGTRDANGVYLSGEIDARRGSIVREQFQIGDWKSGDVSFTMIQDKDPQQKTHLFPIYEYFIQNVESPVKYHPGSALYCSTAVDAQVIAYANDIKVVGVEGEPAMFLMNEMADAENTWVRKWYDVQHDKQVYEVNSGAQLGSMVINLGEVPKALIDPGQPGIYNIVMDSRKYVLPLTNNMKIHLLSGYMQFTQSTSCLPGMEVEIDKESTISIINQDRAGVVEGALYFYDSDQWGRYVRNNKFGTIVHYSATLNAKPVVRNVSSAAAIGDAILNVHGTFQVGENCAVYTTAGKTQNGNDYTADTSTGGASIISTNGDAGTFVFGDDAPAALGVTIENGTFAFNAQGELNPDVLVNYDNSSNGIVINPTARGNSAHIYGFELCTSARLKNGDGGFSSTDGAAAGKSYCYMNDRWTSMEVAAEDECFMKDNFGTFYAKPAEYVAVVATVAGGKLVGNDDHTFSDAAGAGRLFILMADDCQWWEVEKKDNLYHCIHPNNDTYYYWDETEGKWLEQRFTITWKNWDGEEIKSYTYDPVTGDPEEVEYRVTYGTMAEYLGSNPTRPEDIDYTYDFTGWSPALDKVTADVTYTATYKEQPRKYTIIFQNEGGTEIERHFLTHNEMPVCENVPTRPGFTLEWSPAIAAVVGDATYRATWLEEPPTEYEVTFFDYDGTTELQKGNVAVGTVPTPPADPTGKPATSEFTYAFDHWSPVLEAVSVTSAKSYTAVYREVAQTYTVRFYEEDGTTQIGGAQTLAYGAMPEAPVPTKQNPQAGYTYAYVWQNKADASKALETVKEDADYKAVFTGTLNKYTVTVKSNPSGACAITGAGLYGYNTSATLTLSVNSGYTFTGWSDGQEGTNTSRTIIVTEDKELVANFTVAAPDWTITWKSEDGATELAAVGQKDGTATTFTGATPTKEATAAKSYTFYGWSTEVNGGGTVYKNGMTPNATADATYYAYYKESARTYDIIWKSETGAVNLELDYDQPYGAAIAYNGATPTKTATAYYTYTFDGWSTEVGGSVVVLPATVESDATFYAHFKANGEEPVVEDLEIGVNATETLTAATTKQDLIITSNGVASGQLVGAEYLTLTGEAIFRLEQTFAAGTWYAVAVPWAVAAGEITADGVALTWNGGNYLAYYDGAIRAAQGKVDACWHYVANGDVLQPGRLYMLYLQSSASEVRFPKQAGSALVNTTTSVAAYGQTTGDEKDANWNGIANPAVFHGYLNAGATDGQGQVYNPAEGKYELFEMDNHRLIVGQPIFVQAPAAKSIVVNATDYSAAPARRAQSADRAVRYDVRLTADNKPADRIIVRVNEDKEADQYIIGQDLVKFGVSSKVAQMWINRYDAQLCINTVAPQGESTDFPLSLFAPKNGEYIISLQPSAVSHQNDLYLTLNGEAIWNLSEGAYVAHLQAGTHDNYGLRVSAPKATTGIDEAVVDAKDETRKVLIDGQVYIIRGEKVYSIDGQMVR